eukprot:14639934-Alexandrium_andersonii.AAC.1
MFAMQLLQDPVVLFNGRGQRTLGGPGAVSDELKQICVQRMVTWTQLATEVVQTEWPDYAVIASMRVFHPADSASS